MKHQIAPRQNSQRAHSVPTVNILGVGVTPSNLSQVIATLGKWREEGRREPDAKTQDEGASAAREGIAERAPAPPAAAVRSGASGRHSPLRPQGATGGAPHERG